MGGQFELESGGQFDWIFHKATKDKKVKIQTKNKSQYFNIQTV